MYWAVLILSHSYMYRHESIGYQIRIAVEISSLSSKFFCSNHYSTQPSFSEYLISSSMAAKVSKLLKEKVLKANGYPSDSTVLIDGIATKRRRVWSESNKPDNMAIIIICGRMCWLYSHVTIISQPNLPRSWTNFVVTDVSIPTLPHPSAMRSKHYNLDSISKAFWPKHH